MDAIWKEIILRQFGASIAMFENALRACPETLWQAELWSRPEEDPRYAQFWYLGYHTLFFLDLYLSGSVEGFQPPPPYNLDELDPAGLLPERVYTPTELLAYLAHCREKMHGVLRGLTAEQAARECGIPWSRMPYAELLLDNLRHVQEHSAQLSLFLGQQRVTESRWVAQSSRE